MNKVLYAREGAKSIMDRTFVDFPWQVHVEVDGVEIEVPEVSVKCKANAKLQNSCEKFMSFFYLLLLCHFTCSLVIFTVSFLVWR